MTSQKSNAKAAVAKIAKVRTGLPPLVRSDKAVGGESAAAIKLPTKPKAKETLRDGAAPAKKTKN